MTNTDAAGLVLVDRYASRSICKDVYRRAKIGLSELDLDSAEAVSIADDGCGGAVVRVDYPANYMTFHYPADGDCEAECRHFLLGVFVCGSRLLRDGTVEAIAE